MAPLQIQRPILFLLQKGTKHFNLVLAGFFVGSLEGFGTVTITMYHKVFYVTRFNFVKNMLSITGDDCIDILLYLHIFYKPYIKNKSLNKIKNINKHCDISDV